MTIETKYNIGSVVWGEWYMEIEKCKVKGISIIVEQNKISILYDLVDTQDYTNEASMTEEYLFPTKEELLKSL
jgi:hypothetical protein